MCRQQSPLWFEVELKDKKFPFKNPECEGRNLLDEWDETSWMVSRSFNMGCVFIEKIVPNKYLKTVHYKKKVSVHIEINLRNYTRKWKPTLDKLFLSSPFLTEETFDRFVLMKARLHGTPEIASKCFTQKELNCDVSLCFKLFWGRIVRCVVELMFLVWLTSDVCWFGYLIACTCLVSCSHTIPVITNSTYECYSCFTGQTSCTVNLKIVLTEIELYNHRATKWVWNQTARK